MTARATLVAALTPLLPERWKLVDTQRNISKLSQPTVQLKQGVIKPSPTAPLGNLQVDYTVTLIDPSEDVERAELALDETVLDLYGALDAIAWLNVEQAEKVAYETYVAYDFTVQVFVQKG